MPEEFGSVGQCYRDFRQLRDAEARAYLDPGGASEDRA
jgi:predicted phosphoribosyltransferase